MLHPCMNVHESFRDALLHPYESAEALCRRRSKVSTAAKWQVVWADSCWYGPAMMSNCRDGLIKGILMYAYSICQNNHPPLSKHVCNAKSTLRGNRFAHLQNNYPPGRAVWQAGSTPQGKVKWNWLLQHTERIKQNMIFFLQEGFVFMDHYWTCHISGFGPN